MLRSEELSTWNDLLHEKIFIIIMKEPKIREVRLQAIGFMFVISYRIKRKVLLPQFYVRVENEDIKKTKCIIIMHYFRVKFCC